MSEKPEETEVCALCDKPLDLMAYVKDWYDGPHYTHIACYMQTFGAVETRQK